MSSPRSMLIIVSGGYLTGKSGGLRGKDNDRLLVSLHLHSADNDNAASNKALQSYCLKHLKYCKYVITCIRNFTFTVN